MNIGHHRRKWKSPILGVDEFCFVAFFWLFFSVRGTNTFFIFFRFCAGKFSSAAPTRGGVCSSIKTMALEGETTLSW